MNVQGLGIWVSKGLHKEAAVHAEFFVFSGGQFVCVCARVQVQLEKDFHLKNLETSFNFSHPFI